MVIEKLLYGVEPHSLQPKLSLLVQLHHKVFDPDAPRVNTQHQHSGAALRVYGLADQELSFTLEELGGFLAGNVVVEPRLVLQRILTREHGFDRGKGKV